MISRRTLVTSGIAIAALGALRPKLAGTIGALEAMELESEDETPTVLH